MPAQWVLLAFLATGIVPTVSGKNGDNSERAELTFEVAQQFAKLQRLIDAANKAPSTAYLRQRLAKQVKDAFVKVHKDTAAEFEMKEALVTKRAAVRLGGPLSSEFETLKSQVKASSSFSAKIEKLCSNNMGDKDDCERKATNAVFCQLLKRTKPDLAAQNCRVTDTHLLEADNESHQPTVNTPDAVVQPPKPSPVSPFEKLKRQVRSSKSFAAKVTALCQKVADKVSCEEKATDAVFCQLLERKRPELAAQNCQASKKEAIAQHPESPSSSVHVPPQESNAPASSLPEGAQLEAIIDSKIGPDMGAMFRKLETGRQGVASKLADLRKAEAAESDQSKKAGIHADVERLEGIQTQMASHFETVAKLFHA